MSPRASIAAHWKYDVPVAGPTSAASFSGLQAWYDASQITGVSDGAAVASWPDMSGNSRTLAQATGSLQPLYRSTSAVTALPNSKPVVQFDGTDDYLAYTGSVAAQPYTTAIVWKDLSSTGQHVAIDNNSATPSELYVDTDRAVKGYAGSAFGSGFTSNTTAHTFIFVGSGASSLWRVDSAADVTGNPGTNGLTAGLSVGRNGSAAAPWNGWIAEIAIYNRVLTSTERGQLAGLLKTKYGTP